MAFLTPDKRRKRFSSISSLAAIALGAIVAGCGTVSDVPIEDAYQPPPPGAPVAYLKGTSISESGLFGSEHRGFIGMIDLKSIPGAIDRWSDPIALAPGKHTIVAEYRFSNFMTRAYLPLDAQAGVTYQLMIRNSRDAVQDRSYNDFWIVNSATGDAVTPVYHRPLTGGKKGTLFRGNN